MALACEVECEAVLCVHNKMGRCNREVVEIGYIKLNKEGRCEYFEVDSTKDGR